jgi:hypothetical protein
MQVSIKTMHVMWMKPFSFCAATQLLSGGHHNSACPASPCCTIKCVMCYGIVQPKIIVHLYTMITSSSFRSSSIFRWRRDQSNGQLALTMVQSLRRRNCFISLAPVRGYRCSCAHPTGALVSGGAAVAVVARCSVREVDSDTGTCACSKPAWVVRWQGWYQPRSGRRLALCRRIPKKH